MNKRDKIITLLLLITSLIIVNILPVYAWVEVTYPDKWTDFRVVNHCPEGYKYVFSEIAPEPYNNDTILTSFTNSYDEELIVGAMTTEAKSIYLYNNGPILASDDDPYHNISIQGYDGHGEEFYVNTNFFNMSENKLENLTLGELDDTEHYEPVEGLYITPRPNLKNEDGSYNYLNTSIDVVKNDYYQPDQTWIKITFNATDKPNEEEKEVPEYIKNGFKREFLNDNSDYIETVSQVEYSGSSKKNRPVIKVSYNGKEYSSEKGGALKVSYTKTKNAGQVTVTIKKVKKNKDVTSVLKGKTITYEIIPITVSDNNMKPTVKNGKVKSIKVLTGGKYKKVKKTMWSLSGKELVFTGNYTGSVSLNNI